MKVADQPPMINFNDTLKYNLEIVNTCSLKVLLDVDNFYCSIKDSVGGQLPMVNIYEKTLRTEAEPRVIPPNGRLNLGIKENDPPYFFKIEPSKRYTLAFEYQKGAFNKREFKKKHGAFYVYSCDTSLNKSVVTAK